MEDFLMADPLSDFVNSLEPAPLRHAPSLRTRKRRQSPVWPWVLAGAVSVTIAAVMVWSVLQPPVITVREYSQLQTGMSYAEVSRILGRPGELQESGSVSIPGHPSTAITAYRWANSDDSGLVASFADGELVVVMQHNLPE